MKPLELSVFIVHFTDGLRLNGTYKGRLEILHNGEWGMICDKGFGEREAQVACHELGFLDSGNIARVYSPPNQEPPLPKVIGFFLLAWIYAACFYEIVLSNVFNT